MITDDHLIGWLCFLRLNAVRDHNTLFMPTVVREGLVERGWIEVSDEEDWEGDRDFWTTEAGRAVSDLHSAEWGINAIPESEEA